MAKANKTTVTINDIDVTKLFEANEPLRITHAMLVDGKTCTYSYAVRLDSGENDIITNECARQFHNDLKRAFQLLDGHLAVITEQVDADEVTDIDQCIGEDARISQKLEQLQVHEVKISGNIETGSIILMGSKLLKTGNEINIKTPKQALDGDYLFINELVASTQGLIEEITLYHNGKSRPEIQGGLFDNTIQNEADE